MQLQRNDGGPKLKAELHTRRDRPRFDASDYYYCTNRNRRKMVMVITRSDPNAIEFGNFLSA